MSLLLGVGGLSPGTHALPLVDDVVDVIDNVDDGGAVDDSVDGGLLDDAGAPLGSVLDDLEDDLDPVVEPIVEEIVDPLVGDVIDDVDDVVPEPDVVTTQPTTPGQAGSSTQAPLDPSAPPEDQAGPAVSADVISTIAAGEETAEPFQPSSPGVQNAIERPSDDRLAALLLAAAPSTTVGGTVVPFDGVLAWLAEGPTIARLLAAPLALIHLLVRALLSAGSGLVAPLSLTAALVIRQLHQARRTAPVG